MKFHEREHCGWFRRSLICTRERIEGESIDKKKRGESHLSALLHRHCTPVYIERERKKEVVLLPYWHIAANQPSCFFAPFAYEIDSIELFHVLNASILFSASFIELYDFFFYNNRNIE